MNKIKTSINIVLMCIMMGCTQSKIDMPPIEKNITERENPILIELNGMLKVFRQKPLTIVVANMENETGTPTLPSIINTTVKKSFNNIGDMVHVVADTNNYTYKGGEIYAIHGAITKFYVSQTINRGYQSDLEINRGKTTSNTSTSLDKESKISHLAITFNPENPRNGLQIPYSSVSNSITIYQKSSANEFGFSILGSGIGYNKTITKAQGIDEAIERLVDVNVVEVIGKLTTTPYWILTKKKPNRHILNGLINEFIKDKPYQKVYKVSYLLTLRGYYTHPTYSIKDNRLKQAIINYKKSHGMRANTTISSRLYRSLLI